ncbi:SusC/RagA family TonB-linked outer membrane protein [Sphingobacterium thalpophilum]|uniref:SusC/RagA family TonB-linked outer membrane protein n=1 Tax=Sphingobacterium thalpophilum TaxID=259 RepID=UPI002D799D03|nr:TonB-dependent receptor [Sphingobacterium thalpophilum]
MLKNISKDKPLLFRSKFKLALITLALPVHLWAQSNKISGIVVDEGNVPLTGVSIRVNGTDRTIQTDSKGVFQYIARDGDILQLSSVGYEPATVTVQGNAPIRVQLKKSNRDLDEVVVIGYGTARKRDLTGAVGSIKGSEIKDIPVTTTAQALTGKIAGVNIVTQSGAPGSAVNVTVRGGTSFSGSSNPLVIVDGFVLEGGLNNVDASDIESVDVLKDASASAIYGSRGANGVILITTKSAKSGRTNIDYNTYFSFETLSKKLELLGVEDYVKYQYEYQTLGGRQQQFANMFGGDPTAPDFGSNAYTRIKQQYGNRTGIDWQQEVFGSSAVLQSHNVNINGGNEKTKLMLSYNNMSQDGILAKSGFNRNSIRAKVNHNLFRGVDLDFNTLLQDANTQGGGSLGGMLKMSILQPVTGGIRFTDEQLLHADIAEELQATDSQYDIYNPIIMNDAITKAKASRLAVVNLGLNIKFLKDFTFRTAGSYQWKHSRNDMWDDGRTVNARNNGGPYGSRSNAEGYQWQLTNTLSWTRQLDKHNLNLMIGHEVLYSKDQSLGHTYYGFPQSNFGLNDVSLATRIDRADVDEGRYGLVSGFARAIYNYNDRYLFTATLRADGNSKFKENHQWGYFPSASAAWNIHKEHFMEGQHFFDQLKLRAGYGSTGNDNIGNVTYATLYGSTIAAINNTEVVGLKPSDLLGNPELQWEKTQTTNIALDIAILKNRISLTTDFYSNKSSNLLLKQTIPTSTGYRYQNQNVAALRNRGVEFTLRTLNIKRQDFQWQTNFNITFNRSKTLGLYGSTSEGNDFMLNNLSSRIDFITRVGETVGQFYGYKFDGVYTTDDFIQNTDGSYSLKDGVASLKGKNRSTIKPGDVKYMPTAGETDSNGNPVWSTNDRTVIGSPEPKFFGGIGNSFSYKNFDLNVFLNFAYGNKAFNMNTQRFMGPYLPNQNALKSMAGRFTLIDPNTGAETRDLVRLAELNPNQHEKDHVWSLNAANNIAISDALDYYLEDASFLRINNVTLGYSMPQELSKRAFIQKMRVFLTLNNIHTFTKFSGYDPEVASTSSILTRGVDNSAYPRTKSFVLGVNLTF